MSTALYRHFDKAGALLYVGISLSWPLRTKAHAQKSRWFDLVDKVEIERFPTREDALAAERDAIQRERPKFNVVHNRQPAPLSNARRTTPAYSRTPLELSPESMRFMGTRERRRAIAQCKTEWSRSFGEDPLLKMMKGPDAIVGPPLIYRDELISVVIAHGISGVYDELTEVVLGEFVNLDLPAWADCCDSVMTIRRGDQITMAEARDARGDIIQKLRGHLRSVEAYDSDLALAVAYASRFPSEKSRQILDQVAVERRAA